MMKDRRAIVGLVALAAALAACGEEPASDKEAVPPVAAVPAAAPTQVAASDYGQPAAFAQCAACHKVDANAPRSIGPHLVGVIGAPAASRGDFRYSPALSGSGIVWDEANLDAFLTNPQKVVPGTMMAFGGVADAARRKEIIDYLATLQ